MKYIKIILISFSLSAVLLYLLFGLLLYSYQDKFMYYPDKQDFEACKGFADSEKINYKGTIAADG